MANMVIPKYILVCYDTDFGMDLLGQYKTKEEAFDDMIDNIESRYTPYENMRECKPDDSTMYQCEADGGGELYWGDDWANCYDVDNGYSDHYQIFKIEITH